MANPYAPPQALVRDITDPSAAPAPADRGSRLGASILDSFVFAAMVVLPAMVVAVIIGLFATRGGPAGSTATMMAVFALGAAGFVAWCWLTIKYMNENSQSIGKKILGIKVVRTDGAHASLGRIFWLRNVVNTLLGMIPLYGIVDALFIFGESRQCLHDKLADTIVVKA